jgi:hypothetical protein
MIIKPIDNNLPIIGRTNTEYQFDEFGNKYYDIIRRISINSDITAGRLERISVVEEPDNHELVTIYKESGIGNIIPNHRNNNKLELVMDDYMYSALDYFSGDYLQSGGYCSFPLSDDSDSCVAYGDLYDMPLEKLLLEDKSYNKRTLNSLTHTRLTSDEMYDEVDIFENEYQLPYTETIGMLNVFFSSWTYGYPFEARIIIDCVKKLFNIPKINYLPIIGMNMIKDIYIKFIKEVDFISNYLFSITEQAKKNIKFLIFLYPFGSIIKIKDFDRNTIDNVKVYSPNQAHALMKNVNAGGIGYVAGDSLELLTRSQFKEPILQALECSDIFY